MSAFKNTQYQTELTLSNAVELATKVIRNIAGEDISTHIDGKLFSNQDIKNLITAEMKNVFISNVKGA